MKYEYKAIAEKYLYSFNDELEYHVKKGWEPIGSLSMAHYSGCTIMYGMTLRREIKTETETES